MKQKTDFITIKNTRGFFIEEADCVTLLESWKNKNKDLMSLAKLESFFIEIENAIKTHSL